ncbi:MULTISPECIES: hypothetical protein [unclassified Flavobacterium]|uniref:hypothetical protein n=1 Tax=unclassified Flavobacterium TaxID=196869 RepID=UPI00131E85A0|nr:MULTISPECIES: hypothetical protein [unclassified Flavobacterium]
MQLKNTIDFYFSFFENKKLFRVFPKLKEELLSQYNQIIYNSDKQNSNIDLFQEYFQVIDTGIKDDHYIVSWLIGKIDNLVSKNNLPKVHFNIKSLFSDIENLDPNKSLFYSNKDEKDFKPIYVSYYLPIGNLIVVDGNHRVKEFINRRKEKIEGYYFTPDWNFQTMNELSFSLYKFHHNLVTLHSLCQKKDINLWSFKVDKSLMPNTFYGDKTVFKNLIFKKFLLLFCK